MCSLDVCSSSPVNSPDLTGRSNWYHRVLAHMGNTCNRGKSTLKRFFTSNPGANFFCGWLMFVYGFLIFALGFVLIAAIVLCSGIILINLPIYYWVQESNERQFSEESEDSEDSDDFQGEVVIIPDNPPRYDSLPDLRPELFKVPPPSYDEVCHQIYSPPSYSSALTIVPVHQPGTVEVVNFRENFI